MYERSTAAVVACIIAATIPSSSGAQSLKGSPGAVAKAYEVARDHKLTFFKTPAQIRDHVTKGLLVKVSERRDLALHGVSFPYALPETATFVERLATVYHAGCGEQLVVTSLTRPVTRQPKNASSRSVHPAGMAVDIRRSKSAECRELLERTLLELEGEGVLEVTRERYPPHYHVSVFPSQYMAFITGPSKGEAARRGCDEEGEPVEYTVQPGDSLWSIARKHGTSLERLKALNKLSDERIDAGKRLVVPSSAPCQEQSARPPSSESDPADASSQ